MAYLILGTEEPKDYETFLIETLEKLRGQKIKGVALVALTEDNGGEVITGWWNMEQGDIAIAAMHLQYDAIDRFILANAKRYQEAAEEESDEDEEE